MSPRPFLFRVLPTAALALACLLACRPSARAQEDGNRPRKDNERYPLSGAHVPMDDRARQLIHQADAAVARKDWKPAVRNYQMALDQYPDFVHEVTGDTFVGIRPLCTEKLRALPPEGKAAYREMFEGRARARFEEAMRTLDRGALLAIAEGFPLSGWADRAAGVLGSLLLEEGNVRAAVSALERACASDLPEIARPWFLPLASAYHRAGERERLERLLERIPRVVGDATLLAGGSPLDVQRRIKDWAASLPPANGTAAPPLAARPTWDRWECLGGDASRSRPLAPDLEAIPAKMWSVTVPQGSMPHSFQREFLRDPYAAGDDQHTPLFPVVADGMVFIHNDTQVFAYELLSSEHFGRRAWSFPQPARLQPADVIFEEHALHSSTLADGRVFVNVVWTKGEAERQLDWLDVKLPLPNRALIALEAHTGRLLWRFGGMRTSDSPTFADAASVACAPASLGPDLWFGAVFQANATNPIEHYVCKLDAATGELRWRSNVCSGFLEMNLFNNPTRESVGTPVTVWHDTVLYCTNMGVIAAVDARAGRIRWLKRYRQYPIGPTRDIHAERMQRSWANNPILVQGGSMFVAPTDSPYLYALDVQTGKELWTRIRNQYDQRDPVLEQERFLLGVNVDSLFVSGAGVVALDLANGRKRWSWRPEPNDHIMGRGGVTREAIYVPTKTRLQRLTHAGAEKVSWKWTERDPGNLLIADSVLLVTGPRHLTAFFSIEGIEKQIAQELARNPENPYLRYRVGLNHQKAGRSTEASQCFEDAVRIGEARSDADGRRAAEAARQALYRLHVDLGRQAWDRKNRKTGLAEFALARQWARDAGASVEIAFTVSALLHEEQSYAEAVAELQGVIDRNPEVPYAKGTAREYARGHIDVILGAAGRAVYAPFEEKARQLAAAAAAGGSLDDWRRVVERYPNSTAAEEALLRVAERLYQTGLFNDADARLRELLQYHGSALLSEAYRLLVQCSEQRGAFTTARNHLLQLQRKFPTASVRGPTGPVPVRDFVQERLARPEYRQLVGAGSRRELSAPLKPAWTLSDAGSTDLALLQPGGPLPTEAADLVFLSSRGIVRAVRWNTGQEIWRAQVEKGIRASLFFDRALVLCGHSTVYALGVSDGRELWRLPLEEYYAQDARTSEGCLYLSVYQRANKEVMRLIALDASSGREIWSFPYRDPTAEGFLLADEWVVVPSGLRELTVLDREKGMPSHVIALPGRTLRLLMPAPNRILSMPARNALACFDIPTGKQLWKQETGLIMNDSLIANGSAIAFVERDEANMAVPLLVVMDPETGKRRVRQAISEGDFPFNAAIDDKSIYVTFRERAARDRLYVTAFQLATGSRIWTCPRLAKGASLQVFNPIMSGPLFLLNGAHLDQVAGRWYASTTVIQRADGSRVQEIAPEPNGTQPPMVVAENGVLAVIQGGCVTAYVGE